MRSRVRRAVARFTAIAGCVAALAGVASAQTPEEFYRGKTINIFIGFSSGGGYDIYARALARHLGRRIPGSPNIVPQNMPGAGSQKAMEYVLNVAPKDGLSMATFGRSLVLAPLLEGAKFDPTRLSWVGSITGDSVTCIAWHGSGVKKWEDMRTTQFTAGGLGKGSDPEMFPLIVKNLFGLNVKLVSGYPGTNDVMIAMERGEVDGMCGYSYSTLRASHKAWVDDKKVVILAQGGLTRNKHMPDVPMMLDLTTSERQKQTLTLLLATQPMARPFAMPPGTPQDRLDAIRAAFMATMTDTEFVKETQATGLDVEPMAGAEIAAILQQVFAMPADIIADARRAVGN